MFCQLLKLTQGRSTLQFKCRSSSSASVIWATLHCFNFQTSLCQDFFPAGGVFAWLPFTFLSHCCHVLLVPQPIHYCRSMTSKYWLLLLVPSQCPHLPSMPSCSIHKCPVAIQGRSTIACCTYIDLARINKTQINVTNRILPMFSRKRTRLISADWSTTTTTL